MTAHVPCSVRSLVWGAILGAVVSLGSSIAVFYPKLRDAQHQAAEYAKQEQALEESLRVMENEALTARQALQTAHEIEAQQVGRETRQHALERVEKAVDNEAASSSLAEYLNARR